MVLLTSMGVRLAPISRMTLSSSDLLRIQATSAETNVGSISSALGKRVLVLTKFVKDSSVAAYIKRDLRRRGMEFLGADVAQGGPWGYRHQFNIADAGFGVRAPRVQNDRAGEVGATICADDFDLQDIFVYKGVKLLHTSGLFAAISPETAEFCLACIKLAKANGTLISFDLNYRESFWAGRRDLLRSVFSEIASLADILIGNEEDFQLALGINGPEAGGVDISNRIDAYRDLIRCVASAYPNVSVYATTLREVINANEHKWGAIVNVSGRWYQEPMRQIAVMDRIGGGDAFSGGLLYAILSGKPEEDWVKLAWATGTMAVSVADDFVLPASEKEIWNIWEGNARIIR